MSLLTSYHVLLHLAALISVGALALRDQLKLRAVLLLSIVIALLNNAENEPDPDWPSLFWNLVAFGINLVVLVQIVLDRTPIGMSAEQRQLFEAFGCLTPGEFRDLLALAAWRTAESETVLTREGEAPGFLFYVVSGEIHIEKAGRLLRIAPQTFIGEVSFLHRGKASATVRLAPGSRYLEWPAQSLDRRIAGRDALKHAMVRLISFDMAQKVARA